jgi:ABC-type oligopeptide transport system ATPase subunit
VSGKFIRDGHDALLIGSPGTGKSHIAKTVAHAAIQTVCKVVYREAHTFFEDLFEADQLKRRKKVNKLFSEADLLVINDLFLRKKVPEQAADDLLDIILNRYSFWLAHMLRLNIVPEGYIYPKEQRPVRDLLRRRLLFVKHRTSHILSLQSMISRNLGTQMAANAIKKLDQGAAETLFDSPHLVLAAQNNIAVIHFLTERIKLIERAVKSQLTLREEFKYLLTVPGIGDILALTIMAEV